MPRVHTATKSPRATKKPYVCTGCREEIVAGQKYYTWSRRFQGPRYRHVSCGFPRPTELSDRKTAQVEEAIGDAETALQGVSWTLDETDEPGGTVDLGDVVSQISDILSEVGGIAEDVGSEYESSADNMPESLQYGYQAEAMREVAGELSDWADNLNSWSPSAEESIELDELGDDGDRETWASEAQDKIDEAVTALVDEANEAMQDLPEYQG